MFTGLVEEVGRVVSLCKGQKSCVLTVQASAVLVDVHIGDSMATNGVCLTVTTCSHSTFSADVMNETLARSSLGSLRPGSPVNLERAMLAEGRFGGHIVSGHIDGVGTITSIKEDSNAVWYTIEASLDIIRLIVEKGSIAIDGISLTVAHVDERSFSVSIIPHTRAQTNLASKHVGDVVNLENDLVGKYVERLLFMGSSSAALQGATKEGPLGTVLQGKTKEGSPGSGSQGITREFLIQQGF
jgi:riboflavin synthase